MTPPEFDYLRRTLKDISGLHPSADKQYLIESGPLPPTRKRGLYRPVGVIAEKRFAVSDGMPKLAAMAGFGG